MKDELLRLAERCEAASGPDQELELTIALAMDASGNLSNLMRYRKGFDGRPGFAWDLRRGAVLWEGRNDRGDCTSNGGIPIPAYTASLDAAMTLVPENHEWQVGWCGNSSAWVRELPDADEWWGYGQTAALALTAAALRARAAGEA